MRDCAVFGYTVGINLVDVSIPPVLLNRENSHIMSYDIEAEYFGPRFNSLNAPMLCVCVCVCCSCGYRAVVSRSKTFKLDYVCHVVEDNSSLAEMTISLICSHNPSFLIGHNVYEFDNVRLACALKSDSSYRQYFIPTSHMIGKGISNMGFILCIPGINNLDTYRYIKKAMPQRFKSFALANLALDLGLTHKKLDTSSMTFSLTWYKHLHSNSHSMTTYNMMDCEVTLELCFKLDLVNQLIAISNITRSYIIDVMLSSTGAIAASALCAYALTRQCRYNWTRCDYHPDNFEGGYVHFRRPLVCSHPMIIDFVSMYPTIMSEVNISPECIDFISLEELDESTFELRLLKMYYSTDRVNCYVSIVQPNCLSKHISVSLSNS
jgi:DNA polymerase elongation subunit (family B)